jgi:flagellar hook-basal body complex protein FliE
MAETNQQLMDADQQVTRLALGETDNLHQVMISLERAKLSFQLMVQVRNKFLEAYQDVLRMQI